jgi:hypothetical protein
VLGEAVDTAVASSPPASSPAPTLIPAGAAAGAPTEPPAAADVEMAEVPLPPAPLVLVIPDSPVFDHEEGAAVVAEVGERRPVVGAKAKTPLFARCLRRNRWTNGDKTTGRLTLCPIHHQTKTCDEVVTSCDLVQHGGPRVIWPIVTGPAWPLRITSLICKGIPVITVCIPALWEYSGDNLGD